MSLNKQASAEINLWNWKLWIGIFLGLTLLALILAWVSTRFQGVMGWPSFWIVFLLATGILLGTWWLLRSEKPPGWLLGLLIGAAILRLTAGIFWYLVMPTWGHGTPAEQAGYIMADAYARDQAAWKMARSDASLWSAFRNQRTVDQYGGLLFLSVLLYRYLGSDIHQPLLIVVITAAFSALGVLFTWALAHRAWDEAAAWLAAWILALYPEAVLLGSSQMREAFTITLTVIAFFGLLQYQRRRSWTGLAWIIIPLLFFLPLSPPFAALLLGMIALTAFCTMGNLDSNLFRQPRIWLIFGLILILVLVGLWVALSQFTPDHITNPLAMLSWWLRKSAQLQAYTSQHASGWMQKVFKSTPEWTHLPMLIAYGVVQPFLPAAIIVGSNAPAWRWITLWRSLGWTFLLIFLIYAPWGVFRRKETQGFIRAILLVVWITILVAAFRGGADMWDNPRYRATFAGLQVALVAWILVQQRYSPDPWLRRALLVLASILLWFLPWYLNRYTGFPWPVVDFFPTLVLGLLTGLSLAAWDWARTRKEGIDNDATN